MLLCQTASRNYIAAGFTLIELSIVLVIIGLIVGGVLVGQDLIRSAAIRATISQMEKYNTAVNTFRGKYNQSIPGDMNADTAVTFGFTSSQYQCPGFRDGDGIITGLNGNSCTSQNNYCCFQFMGEVSAFWGDLTYANGQNINLIEGSFIYGNYLAASMPATLTSTNINLFLPTAKIGRGNYFYVFSGNGYSNTVGGVNYYGLGSVNIALTQSAGGFYLVNTPGLSVKEAYSIDTKIDDGYPTSGRVFASYNSGNVAWTIDYAPNASSDGPTTCYNNVTNTYSVNYNGGNAINCALVFQFQ